MSVETLNCPMCGAPQSTESTKCEHCGARLATVSCPSCFGMMFVGAKFCSHCGARADRTEIGADSGKDCPRCKSALKGVLVGKTVLEECERCEGLWVDLESLQEICNDREDQAAVLGLPVPQPSAAEVESQLRVQYLPCPICKDLMNRVNFAHCSGVVVNVCSKHGTWFDKDELRRIVEFIRAGGMDKCRREEIDELRQQKRQVDTAIIDTYSNAGANYDAWSSGLGVAVSVLRDLFRL